MNTLRTLALGLLLAGVIAGPATADPGNKGTQSHTLSCDNGKTVDVVYEVTAPFHVVGTSNNFVIKSLSVTNPNLGEHTFYSIPGFEKNAVDTVTCTFTATATDGSTSTFTAVGIYTGP
jgi:hypothetical protein